MRKNAKPSTETLEAIRAEIQAAKQRIERVRSSRLNPNDLPGVIDETIANWQRQFDGAALGKILSSPGASAGDLLSLCASTTPGQNRISEILAFLAPELLKQRLTEIAQPWTDPGAELVGNRDSVIQEIELEMFALEIEEEKVIEALEDAGLEVFRRPDADPAIILNAVAFED